jgi:hypothetical protein
MSTFVRLFRKSFLATLAVLLLSILAPISSAADNVSLAGPSDCDANAIIRCGVHSTNDLMTKYQADSYVRAVYRHFGISQADMNDLLTTNVAGRVTRTGKVYITSQASAVATGAMTGGRQNMPGSTKVSTASGPFFMRPPSVSFQESSLPAFVSMKNGQFQFAVIASCGNAVMATPKAAPPAPATPTVQQTPATPTQTQSQTQNVVVETTQVVSTPAPVTVAPAPAPAAPAKTLVNTGSTIGVPLLVALATVGLGYTFFRWYMLSRLSG